MKENINLLKIYRELSLIKNRIREKVIEKNNSVLSKTIKNVDILEKDIEFLINHYNYIINIIIIQYSDFGFIINYKLFYKNEILIQFSESLLPENCNRETMNKLILSKINKKRHIKFKINEKIYNLSNIEY